MSCSTSNSWLQIGRWLARQKVRLLACDHYHERHEHPPEPSQPGDAMGIISCGYRRRTLAHRADLMEPAAHGLGGDGDAAFGWQRPGQCGTGTTHTPAEMPWAGPAVSAAGWGAGRWYAPEVCAGPG